jgi:hypothetical protein
MRHPQGFVATLRELVGDGVAIIVPDSPLIEDSVTRVLSI